MLYVADKILYVHYATSMSIFKSMHNVAKKIIEIHIAFHFSTLKFELRTSSSIPWPMFFLYDFKNLLGSEINKVIARINFINI